jgi:Domain of unknown function (DUF4878)
MIFLRTNKIFMKKFIYSFIAIAIMAAGLTSCNTNSPKASAQKFLDALYHNEYTAAKEVASDDTKKSLEMLEQLSPMIPDSVKKAAKKLKVEIKNVKEQGDSATVTYIVNDGATKGAEQTLKMANMMVKDKSGKEQKKWVAQWSKMDQMGGGANGAAGGEQTMGVDSSATTAADSTAAPAAK